MLLTALMLLTSLSVSAAKETLTGQVVGVKDGDTIVFLKDNNETLTVRLAQIDAPEKKQDFGNKSKQTLSRLIFEETVTLKVEAIDRYGRTVGTIYKGDMDINLKMVQLGMAHVYKGYAKDPVYFSEQANSKLNKVGLWVQDNPIEPWLFRKKK